MNYSESFVCLLMWDILEGLKRMQLRNEYAMREQGSVEMLLLLPLVNQIVILSSCNKCSLTSGVMVYLWSAQAIKPLSYQG